MTQSHLYLWLADAILVVHALFVAFVIAGLALVWAGWICRWEFVRNPWFRIAHLLCIGVVAAESLAGFVCPLTTWEDHLRLLAGAGERYEGSWIQFWVHRALFHEWDARVFTVIYVVFFLLVALSMWVVRPRWRRVK
ncbi:MAG: DUF2784 domain-containing protein [Verrucomicrobiota bacterium]